MILVRDIFRLKFGQSKDAIAYWKQAVEAIRKSGYASEGFRILTDLAGADYYTIVLEATFKSVAEWEKAHGQARSNSKWKEIYGKIIALTEKGHREIFTVVE